MKSTAPLLIATLLVGLAGSGRAQDLELDFELVGLGCGDEVFGAPGEVVTIEAFAVLRSTREGVMAWALGMGAEGANVRFLTDPVEVCDETCAASVIGRDVTFQAAVVVDPDAVPSGGPLAGSPQGDGLVDLALLAPPLGRLDVGTTRLIQFAIEVAIPQGEEGEQVRLFFVDGLQGDGDPVINTVTIEGQSVRASDGLELGECSFTVNPRAFRRGDANVDSVVDLTDAVFTLEVLFLGLGEITCGDAADSNDDGMLDISDSINTLEVLFLGTREMPPPGRLNCGKDPTEDFLGDCVYERC